jgi:hypothetical protein
MTKIFKIMASVLMIAAFAAAAVSCRRKTTTAMKYICLIVCIVFSYIRTYGQDDNHGALQVSFGYIPEQKLSVNDKSDAFTFDITGWPLLGVSGDEESAHCLFGLGGGLGIRTYRKIPNETLLNTDDPYKTSATRFGVHIGPGVGFGYNAVRCFISPQFGLWYAGMSNEGPKVNGTIAISGDLIIYMVSIGATYRISSSRLVSTNWSFDNPENAYILIKPAWEFRIGAFFSSLLQL